MPSVLPSKCRARHVEGPDKYVDVRLQALRLERLLPEELSHYSQWLATERLYGVLASAFAKSRGILFLAVDCRVVLYYPPVYLSDCPTMAHTSRDRKNLLTRVRRIKGQAEALERLISGDEDLDCGKVLQQIAAVRGAVAGLMAEVLEGHLREHVAAEGISAEQRRDEVEEVVGILRTYLK